MVVLNVDPQIYFGCIKSYLEKNPSKSVVINGTHVEYAVNGSIIKADVSTDQKVIVTLKNVNSKLVNKLTKMKI